MAEGLRLAQAAIRKRGVRPVNRRALRKYGEFWRALQLVGGGEVRIQNQQGKLLDSDRIKPGNESKRRDRK